MEGEEPEPQTQKPAPSSWAQRTGYSVRAPSERVRAEVQDSHRRDEAAQHRLALQQRQRGLAHVRASSSHRLGGAGATTGAAASVREARMPFVAQAEMDGNPRIRKMQKRLQAQREQKERAEERDRKEQERLKKLQERRGIDMVANRAVNRAKQDHWQQWDAANSHMQASSSSTPVVAEGHLSAGNLMQGTWHLDTKTFHIVRCGDDLQFDGPPPKAGLGRLKGFLTPVAGDWEACLYDERTGSAAGLMRFSLSGGGASLRTCFKKLEDEDWGRPKLATKAPKVGRPLPSPAEVLHSTPAAPSGESVPPPKPAYRERLIEPGLWECHTCTLVNRSNQVLCGACEQPRAESISAEMAPELAHVVQDDPEPEVPSSPELLQSQTPETPEPPGEDTESLPQWLSSHGLQEYAELLAHQGYDDLGDLLEADAGDVERMLYAIEAKPGHILKFKNSLRRSRAEKSSAMSS